MLQPPANKILFEVFLNRCQALNDSQEQKYERTVCARVKEEGFFSVNMISLCVCLCRFILVKGK